jgi:hypothetical protein
LAPFVGLLFLSTLGRRMGRGMSVGISVHAIDHISLMMTAGKKALAWRSSSRDQRRLAAPATAALQRASKQGCGLSIARLAFSRRAGPDRRRILGRFRFLISPGYACHSRKAFIYRRIQLQSGFANTGVWLARQIEAHLGQWLSETVPFLLIFCNRRSDGLEIRAL